MIVLPSRNPSGQDQSHLAVGFDGADRLRTIRNYVVRSVKGQELYGDVHRRTPDEGPLYISEIQGQNVLIQSFSTSIIARRIMQNFSQIGLVPGGRSCHKGRHAVIFTLVSPCTCGGGQARENCKHVQRQIEKEENTRDTIIGVQAMMQSTSSTWSSHKKKDLGYSSPPTAASSMTRSLENAR